MNFRQRPIALIFFVCLFSSFLTSQGSSSILSVLNHIFWAYSRLGCIFRAMEAAKHHGLWIENFPPDIWAYVTWYLSGEDLARLKITGATILWLKIAATGVVRSVSLGKDFSQFKSWPAFLSELPSLKDVSLHSQTGDWWSLFALRLTSVPATLRTLQFSGQFKKNCLFFVGDGGITLNLAEHFPHLECLDLFCISMSNYTWMASSPPTLTKLRIAAWDGTVPLPSSLTFVEVSVIDFRAGPIGVAMPHQLEVLFAGMIKGLDFLLPLLPPSIRKLSYDGATSSDIEFVFKHFPRTLSCLNISHGTDESVERPTLVPLLPPTLTKLEVSFIVQESTWQHLPSTLQYFSCYITVHSCTVTRTVKLPITYFNNQVQSYPFENLPRSITQLELFSPVKEKSFCGPPSESCKSYFPPNLTYLCIPDLQLAPGAAKILPRSLTILSLYNLCERVAEYLPRGLTALSSSNTLASPKLIKFLPKSLTSLYFCFRASDWFHHETGHIIGQDFPEYRNHQEFLWTYEWKEFSLPPHLIQLEIFSHIALPDSFVMNQRLANLLELEIENANFTDLCIPFLSPHITFLRLPNASQISGKCFPALPRYLTYLNLRSSVLIYDSDIQHLPRTLKELNMTSAIHLTDICLSDLPSRLKNLILRENQHITLDSLPNFPYPLRSTMSTTFISLGKWEKDDDAIIGS